MSTLILSISTIEIRLDVLIQQVIYLDVVKDGSGGGT